MGRLKFGVFLPFYAFQGKEQSGNFSLIRKVVLECERLGYHSVWLDDHLAYDDWPILESWTTLSALSMLTSKIRLGTMVICNQYRNPALLAKAAATLDVLSNGRLEFGIGAGIQEDEHIAYGFDFPKASVRIESLSEALEVIKQMWTRQNAYYKGKRYALKDAFCEPKPLQKPYPPITVGGSGDLLLRKVTAPYADRFDFGFLPEIKVYKRKLEVLEKECKAIGRDFGKIEKSCWPGRQVLIAPNEEELQEKIRQKNVLGLSLEEFKKTTFTGTPSQCREQLQVYVELGVTFFMLYFSDLPSFDGLRLFAETVMKDMSGD